MAPPKSRYGNANAAIPLSLYKRPHFFRVLIPNPFEKLHIPQSFMKHLDGEQYKKATLLSPIGKFWNIDLRQEGDDLYLDGGWYDFAEEHDLRMGYFVVFRYEGNMLFTVKVFDETCCLKEYEFASYQSRICSSTSNEFSEVASLTSSQSSAHEDEAQCNGSPSSEKRKTVEISRGETISPTTSPRKKSHNDLTKDAPSNLADTSIDGVPEGINDLAEDSVPKNIFKRSRDEGKTSFIGVTGRRRVKNLHERLFAEGGLPDGTVLVYQHHNKVVLTGVKQGNAIKCDCHNYEFSPSQFEAHAGQGRRRHPYRNIYNSDGKSLHELSLELPDIPRCNDILIILYTAEVVQLTIGNY